MDPSLRRKSVQLIRIHIYSSISMRRAKAGQDGELRLRIHVTALGFDYSPKSLAIAKTIAEEGKAQLAMVDQALQQLQSHRGSPPPHCRRT